MNLLRKYLPALVILATLSMAVGCSHGSPEGDNASIMHRDWFDKHAYIAHGGEGIVHDPDCPCGRG